MSDNTARLGLPELAQMQEMDSAQINDVLQQLDALGSMSVKGLFVDAPPAYGFADAPLLATMCDAVLLVVESGRTRRRPAVEAIERLRSSGALIVGANLTKYKFDTSEYGYRYYEAYDENRVALRPHELAVGLIKRSGT